ncbi:MAG: undecaprenyl-diphosphate phosphatase [Defluviitaleaceae bacterium]|nr:undecaprenyl-diphosphate phosphatase [Defluviitaleaceae bacterium]
MSVFEALVLGVLQGIAEFIPISSSGHLLLLQQIFGIEENLFTFTIVVHVGTLIPVLVIYFNRVKSLIRNPFQKMTLLLILGILPTVVVTLLFRDFIDRLFTGEFLAIGFLVTAVLLFVIDRSQSGRKKVRDISYFDAVFVGIIQAVAIAPGVSRSGSTIFGGVVRGFDKKSAANFSFLLSIPAIIGATMLEIFSIATGETATEFLLSTPVIVGFFSSMIAGYLAIKAMLKLIVVSKLKYFAYYLIVLGLFMLADQLFFNIVF